MKFEKCKQGEFEEEFKSWSDTWPRIIKTSINRNLHLFPGDVGNKGELLGSLVSGKTGTGSGGSGFDLSDGIKADESKFTNLVQPKICKSCKRKNIFFAKKCFNCKRIDFTYTNDSRWGIDAKSSVEYSDILESYLLQLLEAKNNDPDCREFTYKFFKIESVNENFKEYVNNQYTKSQKSNNCNLLPYSFDFYRANPIKLIEIDIKLTENGSELNTTFWNLENKEIEDFPYSVLNDKEILNILDSNEVSYIKSKSWSKKLISETNISTKRKYLELVLRENIKENLSSLVQLRDKNLNKDRGITERKI